MQKLSSKDALQIATNKALNITPSVLVVARLSKVPANAFVEAMSDEDANSAYLGEVAAAFMKNEMTKALEASKKNEE